MINIFLKKQKKIPRVEILSFIFADNDNTIHSIKTQQTIHSIRREWQWSNLNKDVDIFVKKSETCINKNRRKNLNNPLVITET